MHTQVPRFASQIRLGLSVFIITCLSIGAGISFSQIADSQNPPTANQQNIRTWELPDGAIMRLGKGVLGGSDRAIAFSPDGKHLARRDNPRRGSDRWNQTVGCFDEERDCDVTHARETLDGSIAFSPDAKTLAVGTWEGRIELWNVVTARKIASRHGHGDAVFSVAFSPDGSTLASGSRDGTALLWSTADLTKRQ